MLKVAVSAEKRLPKSTGLALSGGGARGIAHAGVLQALDEKNSRPQIISGVSAGAIIAALYANNYSPQKILKLLSGLNYLKILRPTFSKSGFINTSSLNKLISEHLPETFEQLALPVIINATNLVTGKPVYFDSGPLAPALMASCAVPGVFLPVEIDGGYFIDGGITNNLPLEPLRGRADYLIGSHVSLLDTHVTPPLPIKEIIERAFVMMVAGNSDAGKPLAHLLIEPHKLEKYAFLSISEAETLFEIGYQEACRRLELV